MAPPSFEALYLSAKKALTIKMKKNAMVNKPSHSSTALSPTTINSQIYANMEDVPVIAKTPKSLIFLMPYGVDVSLSSAISFSSLTA